MNHTLRSRVSILLLSALLATSATSAFSLDLPSPSSILSSLWDLLAGGKSAEELSGGQTQPAAAPSGSGTGGSGTSSGDGDGNRGSTMDPDG